ncbi:MAG: xanthine dehydrogenase family protein subunit M [Leptolinea sp.]
MQPFDYYKPKDFIEAFQYLTLAGKVVLPLAGATDFIPTYRDGVWKADAVVDIKGLPGMHDLRETSDGLYIGACVRMSDLANSDLVKQSWGLLAEAAVQIGSGQVRNRATIGGNMCTASPCADTPPALSALDAKVLIKTVGGDKTVSIHDFFKGVRKTLVSRQDLVVGLLIPRPPTGSAGSYIKLSRRKGSDLSLVSVAAQANRLDGRLEWKIALGAVAVTVIRVPEAEAIIAKGTQPADIEKAGIAAADASRPISDVRSSEKYRKLMVKNMTIRAIQDTLKKLGQGG